MDSVPSVMDDVPSLEKPGKMAKIGSFMENPDGISSFSPALVVRAGRARNTYAGW